MITCCYIWDSVKERFCSTERWVPSEHAPRLRTKAHGDRRGRGPQDAHSAKGTLVIARLWLRLPYGLWRLDSMLFFYLFHTE